MNTYEVTIPIFGHAYLTVQADSEEEAIELAMDEASPDHVEGWEALRELNRGNVCYAPAPWSAEARLIPGD